LGTEAGDILKEIVAQLGIGGIKVKVTLDIEATSSTPIPQKLVDAILAKYVELKVSDHGVEEE
jgi:hypothetical protein